MSKFTDVFSIEDIESREKAQAKRPESVERTYSEVICEIRKQYRSGSAEAELNADFGDRICDQRRIAQLLGMLDAVFEKNAVNIELCNSSEPWDGDDFLRITVKFS